MHTRPSARVQFGAFELDLSTGELRSVEAADLNNKVLLREQLFQVLRMLIEREGKIVTREEIKSGLWANNTVVDFDQSINATIKALRRTLEDSAENPRYIETLARRGYRLMPPIQHVDFPPETTLEKSPEGREPSFAQKSENTARIQAKSRGQINPHRWKVAVVLASSVILLCAGYLSWRPFLPTAPPRKVMLAVLPFENLTGDPNKEYLADGLTEETISQLGRLNPQQLGVIARTSVMGYKHKDVRLDQIRRDLSVQSVLENSLRGDGDHMRLTAQLIQLKDQTHLWSHDYDYPAKDILNVEVDVAKAVAREIRVRLTSQQQAELAQSHPVSPEAFDAYLQGYYHFEQDSSKDTEMAANYFERATQLDPSYSLAWAGLSRVRLWEVNIDLLPAEEGHRLAREAVERALTLNPNLAQAHAQMARVKEQVDFDWAGADASCQRAIALDPGNPEVVRTAALPASILGRFDQALQLTRRAIDLDPLNADSWEILAETKFYMGQLDEAAADSKKALELNPDVVAAHMKLSEIYVMQGRPQEALPEIDLVRYDPVREFLYAIAYHALGRKEESDAALNELITKYNGSRPYEAAEVYAFRSQYNEAFEWLDRAHAQRDTTLMLAKMDPLLKNLHGDPRFAALLKKLNLPTD
jgi:TolB-like protein/DNA-binding winged helix-turn-helix (wHTH) protein